MKKKLLPLAMLAGLAGVAGTAQANHINPDGLGQVLIYPYYTAEGGNVTNLHVVNTTNEAKAVKVRFLEGENSQEVLDFNLYLSPFDEWTAAVVLSEVAPGDVDPLGTESFDGADESTWGAKIITLDNSCTAPAIPAEGQPFRSLEYSTRVVDNTLSPSDDTNRGLDRTREGYIEIIEMGVLGYWDGEAMVEYEGSESSAGQFGAAAAAKHGASGVPSDCALLRSAWNPGPNPAAGNWFLDATRNITAPTGGLYGYGVIVDVNEGTNSTYSAVAVDNFTDLAVNTNPGSVLPSLANANEFSDVFDAASIWSTDFDGDGIDALSSIFMRAELSNDYVTLDSVQAETDWVITFPTKRFYVQEALLENRQPFSSNWSGASACEHILVEYWDREEQRPVVPVEEGNIDFSPLPPQLTDIPDGFNLCTEVSIMTFNGSSALDSSPRLTYNLDLEEGFDEGWARIDLTAAIPPGGDSANYNERTITGVDIDSGNNIFNGLPVVGFAVQKYVNHTLEVEGQTVLSNYTGLIDHKYTREIVNSL